VSEIWVKFWLLRARYVQIQINLGSFSVACEWQNLGEIVTNQRSMSKSRYRSVTDEWSTTSAPPSSEGTDAPHQETTPLVHCPHLQCPQILKLISSLTPNWGINSLRWRSTVKRKLERDLKFKVPSYSRGWCVWMHRLKLPLKLLMESRYSPMKSNKTPGIFQGLQIKSNMASEKFGNKST